MDLDDLKVQQQKLGPIGLVTADGVVDLGSMRPLREAVRELISEGVRHIVLDLRDVDYMDSAGISVIMTAKRGVSDERGEVYVVTRPGEVERALNLIQMNRVVHFSETPEQAIGELTSAGGGSSHGAPEPSTHPTLV